MNKIGIALAGGGIKAYGELPVIETLFEENIKLDSIAGTSMGSVLASLVAIGLDFNTIEKLALELEEIIKQEKVFTLPSKKIMPFSKEKLIGGLVDGDRLENIFEKAIEPYGITQLKDVKIPLAIPSVDIISGKIVVFVSHPELFIPLDPEWIIISDATIAQAVRASCSFPMIIGAYEFKDYVLVDGGVRMNTPLPLVESYGATKTIAVTLNNIKDSYNKNDGFLQYSIRVMDLLRRSVDEVNMSNDTLHINIPLDDIFVFDIGKGTIGINRGKLVMAQYRDRIIALNDKDTFMQRMRKKWRGHK